jgi:hypothetical protein
MSGDGKLYQIVEEMFRKEAENLGNLLKVRKEAKTRVKQKMYDKKMKKSKDKCVKYLMQMYTLNPDGVSSEVEEAAKEHILEETEIKEEQE